MSGFNKAIIVGRLGKDPDLRTTSGGNAVCNISVATSESYKDKEGRRQEKTEWHRITTWGKTAELCGQYLHKGSEACFEGKLQTRKYEKDGQERYVTEIVASAVQFLGRKDEAPGRDVRYPATQAQSAQPPTKPFRPDAYPQPVWDAGVDEQEVPF